MKMLLISSQHQYIDALDDNGATLETTVRFFNGFQVKNKDSY